jgi:ATP-dependent Clp protease ATP-binding subunit ClpC
VETYKLTPRAKQSLSLAKKEAQLLRNRYAGTEHLLLGLLNIGNSVVTEILEEFGVDIEDLRNIIYDNISQEGDFDIEVDDIDLTPRVEKVLEVANNCAGKLDKNKIDTDHIFLGLLYESDGVANNILQSLGVSYNKVKALIEQELGKDIGVVPVHEDAANHFDPADTDVKKLKNLQKFGIDITLLAHKNKIDPVIGRAEEIDRAIQILCRKRKNNPVLIGAAGVGKTAIVEGLAQRIVKGDVPDIISNCHIISIDLSSLVAGTKYRGQFEERIKNILVEIKGCTKVIVFIDEIHMMTGAGSAEGAMDASNILKPALARGEMKCIGATTPDEYRKFIEADSALDRRFQPVKIKEPSCDETLQILQGIKSAYEKYHYVTYDNEALEAAVTLSHRYITDRQLPDKAIDLIDEAGAANHLRNKTTVEVTELTKKIKSYKKKKESLIAGQQFEDACTYRDKEKECITELEEILNKKSRRVKHAITAECIKGIICKITGIPVTDLDSDQLKKILSLESTLNDIVIGQQTAVQCISDAMLRSTAKLQDPNKPIASFLFLGTTGVGKSYLSKVLAETLFNTDDSFVHIDMSELMEQHSISKLIGSPPGYVGYDQGGKLTEKVRRNPYSLILFDEIEKAHPEVLNVLLQILEEGHLTDSLGRTVNFKNTVVVMTTNVGAEVIAHSVPIGFVQADDSGKNEERKEESLKIAKKQFKPEFINRIDEIVPFNSLNGSDIKKIVHLCFARYITSIKKEYELDIVLDDTAVSHFVETGCDEKYGVRELKRVMKREFETLFARAVLANKFKGKSKVTVSYKKDKLQFRAQKKTS